VPLDDSVVIHCHLSVQISMPGIGSSVNKKVSYYCTTPTYLISINDIILREGVRKKSNNCIVSAASYVKTL